MNRKFLRLTVLLSSLLIVCGTNTSAAVKYTSDDIKHLRNALFCIEDFSAGDDINNDGLTDIYDLCSLREKISLTTGEFKEQVFPATDQYVKIFGRTYSDSDTTWLVHSGSAVEFTINGKSAEITLKGDYGINNSEDYRPRYAVILDDEIILDTTMSTSEKTIELFKSDVPRTAKVKIIHLSEANNGTIGVKEIKVNSDSVFPLIPTAPKQLCIEFIGDSITCAYGVEGTSSSESFKTTTENFMKSYAYLTAQKLDADYSAVCYSGYGIVSGYSSGDKNVDSLLPDYYNLIGRPSDYAHEWDFSKRKNDVVVINLGTNDINYVSAEPQLRSQEFIDGYISFLKMVREKNDGAYIICTMGTMGGQEIYELIEKAVEDYKKETNDEFIMSYHSVTHNYQVDGIGSDWHPSEKTQQNSAYVLSDKICQVLGIESDQLGLDVAADASYELFTDPEKGGSAYPYLNDYDKSFHINTSAGGSSSDALEVIISGIGINKDGIYNLEFDYTTSNGKDIPLIVRSKSDKNVKYFSDLITGGGEKVHFSAEFKASSSDEDTALVFQIGGTDYCNFSLYNLKLVKTG